MLDENIILCTRVGVGGNHSGNNGYDGYLNGDVK